MYKKCRHFQVSTEHLVLSFFTWYTTESILLRTRDTWSVVTRLVYLPWYIRPDTGRTRRSRVGHIGTVQRRLVRDRYRSSLTLFNIHQCCGSMTFWRGSGSGSADPCLWLLDPDPSLFIIDIQEANKKINLKKFVCILLFEGTFTSFFKNKKSKTSRKTVEIKVFFTIFAQWQKDPEPDPYLWLMDPDPKTCGSGGCGSGFGSGSATLTSIYHNDSEDKKNIQIYREWWARTNFYIFWYKKLLQTEQCSTL